MKCLKDNKGSALVMVMAMITVTSLLGMIAMGVALKNYQNVQKMNQSKQEYYEVNVYEDNAE